MSTLRKFPDVTPTTRSFTPGVRPETAFSSQNGSTSFVSFGNRMVDCSLELGFNNLDDTYALLILEHYRSTGPEDYVSFDAQHGLGGMLDTLIIEIDTANQGLKFRYANPPQITSVFPGVSSVRCSFTGYLIGGQTAYN